MTTTGTAPVPAPAPAAPPGRSRPAAPAWLVVGVATALGVAHALAAGRWYAVGSFDDDAGYLLAARSLGAGHGLGAHLLDGTTVAGSAPPGYALLLAPLVRLWPGATLPLRGLSLLCWAATFPLTWVWLARRGTSPGLRAGVLGLLALNPVGATYATMVMAEAPFVVVLLGLLLALDRVDEGWRRLLAVALLAAAAVWLKEAAVAAVGGVVLWLWLRRRWRAGVVVAVVVAASLTPVLAARLAAGTSLAGSRYSQELGAYYSGGLAGRVLHVAPAALHELLGVALPASVVPRGGPLPLHGIWSHVLQALEWQVSIVAVVGVVAWVRRRCLDDPAPVVVAVYLAEVLLWPYMNERRVVLVLPVVLAWYATGCGQVLRWLRALAARRRRWAVPRWPEVAWSLLLAVLLVGPLVAQSDRDYLFGDFQHSSRPAGSRYMALLAAAPAPDEVIETDYTATTALETGHRSAEAAFLADDPLAPELACVPPGAALADMTGDGAGWLLTGALNKADVVDNPCLLQQASTSSWAVRLLRTSLDGASVFELIGPGSTHPGLVDLAAGVVPTATGGEAGSWALPSQGDGDVPGTAPLVDAAGGEATLTWPLAGPSTVAQLSAGGARSLDGPTGPVALQLLEAGRWVTVATAPAGAGDGAAPYLLVRPPAGTVATAVRAVLHGPGRLTVVDLHALGSPAGAPASQVGGPG